MDPMDLFEWVPPSHLRTVYGTVWEARTKAAKVPIAKEPGKLKKPKKLKRDPAAIVARILAKVEQNEPSNRSPHTWNRPGNDGRNRGA